MNRIFVVDKNGFVFYDHREDSFDLLLSVPEDTPTLKAFDKVLVRNRNWEAWTCNLFSHADYNEAYPYSCVDARYMYCIPYEGNEELVGTLNEPKTE